MAPKLQQVTRFVPVADLDRSVRFFETVLGFQASIRMEGYAYVRRDKVAFRLVSAGSRKDLGAPNSQIQRYIDVTDVYQLYAEMKPQLDRLPAGRVKAPFDTSYGQREFNIVDDDVLLATFGERLMH